MVFLRASPLSRENRGLDVYSQLGWLLSQFGRRIGDYPVRVHVIPFLYFVLYTFLIRHAVLDITHSRENPDKQKHVEYGYIIVSIAIYAISYVLERLWDLTFPNIFYMTS